MNPIQMDTPYETQTDEELALAIQSGDEEPFGVLMDRYGKKLMRYGRKFLSNPDNIEDLVQDIFIKVYQNIQSFDAERKFSPWIYRIAHNSFINHIRKNANEPLLVFNFDALIDHPVYKDPLVEQKENEELRVLVERGIEQLPPLYREVVTLHYFEDLGYQEIAEVLHIPIGTVGVRLRRAREILSKHIEYEQ